MHFAGPHNDEIVPGEKEQKTVPAWTLRLHKGYARFILDRAVKDVVRDSKIWSIRFLGLVVISCISSLVEIACSYNFSIASRPNTERIVVLRLHRSPVFPAEICLYPVQSPFNLSGELGEAPSAEVPRQR